MNTLQRFTTPMAEVTLKEGVVYINYLPIQPTLENAIGHLDLVKENLSEYFPLLVIVDIRNVKTITREVREYLGRPENVATIKAGAMLTGSPLSKLVGNLYLQFSKPKFPTKMFSDEQKAAEWLKQYL